MEISKPLRTSQEELEKDPLFPIEDIIQLKEWIETQPEIPRFKNKRLIQFHWSSDYKLEKTKSTVKKYVEYFKKYPEFFSNRCSHDERLQRTMEIIPSYIPPYRNSNDSQLIFLYLKDTDASKFDYPTAEKYLFMLMDYSTQKYGLAKSTEVVVNSTGATFRHVLKISLITCLNANKVLEGCFPIRLKHVHIINANSVVTKLMKIVRPFLSTDLANKILMYSEEQLQSLQQYIEADYLPKDFGGNLEPLSILTERSPPQLEEVDELFRQEEYLIKSMENYCED